MVGSARHCARVLWHTALVDGAPLCRHSARSGLVGAELPQWMSSRATGGSLADARLRKDSHRGAQQGCWGHGGLLGTVRAPLEVGKYCLQTAADQKRVVSELDELGPVDPFSLVSDELDSVSARMRSAVVSEVPALATAANYFFREGSLGKRTRPTVLLLMASALSEGGPPSASLRTVDHSLPRETPADPRRRQQRVAEVAELIHVASLLHDDVLDNAHTRRGMKALNIEVGNKLAILAGDFLLARASVTLAALRDAEVVMLLSTVLEHLVTGEVMQMTAVPADLLDFEHYMRKTHFKTASLIANSSQAVAILGGCAEAEVRSAYEYGQHLGLAFQLIDDVLDFTGTVTSLGKPALSDLQSGLATAPVLFAAEKYPALRPLIQRKFKQAGDVEQALGWVESSDGVARTRELAAGHAAKAQAAVLSFPPTSCPHALRARRALVDLARRTLERRK